MLRPNSPRPSSLARLRRRKRRRRKRLRQVQHQHPAHRKNRRHNKPRLVERRCPDGPATSRRHGPSRSPAPASSSATPTVRRSPTSISRMSLGACAALVHVSVGGFANGRLRGPGFALNQSKASAASCACWSSASNKRVSNCRCFALSTPSSSNRAMIARCLSMRALPSVKRR